MPCQKYVKGFELLKNVKHRDTAIMTTEMWNASFPCSLQLPSFQPSTFSSACCALGVLFCVMCCVQRVLVPLRIIFYVLCAVCCIMILLAVFLVLCAMCCTLHVVFGVCRVCCVGRVSVSPIC